MRYDDLMSLPYEDFGRVGKTKGVDCYGLVLECCRRNGKPLKDIVYDSPKIDNDKTGLFYRDLNVEEITFEEIKRGDLLQCSFDGNLHIAFILSKECVINATTSGVRVSPISAFSNKKYLRIK